MKVEAELELLPIFRQGIEVLLRSNPLLYTTVTTENSKETDMTMHAQSPGSRSIVFVMNSMFSLNWSEMDKYGCHNLERHCGHMGGAHLGDPVPMGTFFSFWVPILCQGPHFFYFRLKNA